MGSMSEVAHTIGPGELTSKSLSHARHSTVWAMACAIPVAGPRAPAKSSQPAASSGHMSRTQIEQLPVASSFLPEFSVTWFTRGCD
jgi:hypothetical protein